MELRHRSREFLSFLLEVPWPCQYSFLVISWPRALAVAGVLDSSVASGAGGSPYLEAIPCTRTRETCFSRSLLRSANFLLQNCAILRNAARIGFIPSSYEEQALQTQRNIRNS